MGEDETYSVHYFDSEANEEKKHEAASMDDALTWITAELDNDKIMINCIITPDGFIFDNSEVDGMLGLD